MTSPSPSSGRAGFFQAAPVLSSRWQEDEVLKRIVGLFVPSNLVPSIGQDLDHISQLVRSKQVIDWVANAEAHPPYLKGSGFDAFGRPNDPLVTSEGWRQLQDLGLSEGMVARAYELPELPYNRLAQFLKYHVWTPNSAIVTCPSAMQDGAASVLKAQLLQRSSLYSDDAKSFLQDALLRLTSRNPKIAWTSGQWMTERTGGSDVANTETLAQLVGSHGVEKTYTRAVDGKKIPLGPWCINGFKWFSSATDCGMVLLLARTSKGLSCFAAPARFYCIENGIESVKLNGLRIQRLKTKLGNRAVPTAEIELENMRGYLVGNEGQGVKVISGMLNITRVHNTVSAVGMWAHGLAIVRAYARVRLVAGRQLLRDVPLFRRTIAEKALEYRACTLLAFFNVVLLGMNEHPGTAQPNILLPFHISPGQATSLLRVITPLAKARTAKSAINGLQECMESLGGVGYLENAENQELNIARIFRDANVLSIWEGTTDVLATDLVRVIKSPTSNACTAIESWIQAVHHAVMYKTSTGQDKGPLPNLQPYDQWVEGAPIQARHLRPAFTSGAVQVLQAASKHVVMASNEFLDRIKSRSVQEILAEGRDVQQRLAVIICTGLLILDALSDGDIVAIEACRRYAQKSFGASTSNAEEGQKPWQQRSEMDALIAFGSIADSGRGISVKL